MRSILPRMYSVHTVQKAKISSWRPYPLPRSFWYATGHMVQNRGTYAQYNPLLYDGLPKICAQPTWSVSYNSKVGASDDVKITVSSFIIVCAIEQYNNNNDQARIIVATRLLCTSYWVHLLNATLPPICMIYSHVKNDLNIQLHEQPVRRIPPIILLHHHFININGFVHTYESVMHICPISIESIGW